MGGIYVTPQYSHMGHFVFRFPALLLLGLSVGCFGFALANHHVVGPMRPIAFQFRRAAFSFAQPSGRWSEQPNRTWALSELRPASTDNWRDWRQTACVEALGRKVGKWSLWATPKTCLYSVKNIDEREYTTLLTLIRHVLFYQNHCNLKQSDLYLTFP